MNEMIKKVGHGLKVTFIDRLAYGCGAIGDTLLYDYIFAYMLLFMTDYAGVQPGPAGTILMLSVFWDCITDPMVGHFSDNSRNPKGRRMPYMLKAQLPLVIVVCLCFVNVPFGATGKFIYYFIVSSLFWTAFTFIQTPYFSFLPEITIDSKSRTSLRAWSVGIGAVGTIALSASPSILAACQDAGISNALSWQITTWFCLAVSVAGYLFCIFRFNKFDRAATALILDKPREEGNWFVAVCKNIAYVVKQKGFIFALLVYFLNLLAYICILSLISYVGTHKLGLEAATISTITLVYTFSRVLFLPIVNKLSAHVGRKSMLAVVLIGGGVLMCILGLLGVNSATIMIIMGFIVGFLGATYYTLVFTLLYDLLDLNYLKTGEKKEGEFTAVFLFLGKLGGAFAGSVTGWLLEAIRYDATLPAQTPETIQGLGNIFTYVPGAIYIVAGLIALAFPIGKKISDAMGAAVLKKEHGEEYSTEGFGHLLQ